MADISQVTLPDNNTYDINAKELASQSKTISNVAIASFSDGADNVPVSELIVNITATQAGSGTPSPSNPRAISGWSECNIHKSGINLWNEEWELGTIVNGINTPNNNRIRTKNYIPVLPIQYYINTAKWNTIFGYDKNKTYIGNVSYTASGSGYILNITNDIKYIRVAFSDAYGTTYNNDISINYPSTDTSYHAYNGTTYTISLGDTYYGGTLNVTTGELTITHGIVDLGTLNWNYVSSRTFFFNTILSGKPTPNYMCDIYKNIGKKGDVDMQNSPDMSMGYVDSLGSLQIKVKNTSYTNAAAFKTAMSGAKLVYELATPTTVRLTPTEVRTLLNCNIFADTGDINKLVYFKTGCESITDIINVMHDDSKMSYSNVYGKKTCNQLTDPGIYYNINPTGSPADGYPTTTLITTYNCQILVYLGLVINTRRVNHGPGGTITFSSWFRLANENDLDGAVIPYNAEYSTTNTIYDEIEALKQRVKNLGG